MPVPASAHRGSRRSPPHSRSGAVLILSAAIAAAGVSLPPAAAVEGHLVVSEVMTGGSSASDEMIELYNPTATELPLEGLELVYVTATGATISRRAAWSLGAPGVPAGSHVLVANEAGTFAPIADALYASGMAATGGSVALRIQGASGAIDAVGWGTAASSWLEGGPAPAAPAGSSLERLPGGAVGSTTDTDDNRSDFAVRSTPDPQNASSAPVPSSPPSPSPSETPSPTPTAATSPTPEPPVEPTPEPTPSPTAEPSSTPTPEPLPTSPATITIAAARAMPDGSSVTIEGAALTASDFGDGGGYLADETGGIAVLLDAGSFARGEQVLVSGVVDDRFSQRTVRATSASADGAAAPPAPIARPTGVVDESVEGRLVLVSGLVDGGATVLTGGLAFDLDDGSGPARVIVGAATGIDTTEWTDGRPVRVIGVVGQRDSTGTGTSGYRVQPRDASDVELLPQATPDPSASPSPPTATTTPSPPASPPPTNVATIAVARAAAKNARMTVRGSVTLASGTVDAGSAVIQDETGAILLRLGDEAGEVALGDVLEVDGVRSTKSGMETLRVTDPPRLVGSGAWPAPRQVRTGEAGESIEAQLIVVRGALTASARRASSGSVSFDVDDGSGPLHVSVGAALDADDAGLERGAWVEVIGVLGQETTGSRPLRGYRVWPRGASDLQIVAAVTDAERLDGTDDTDTAAGRRGPSSAGGSAAGSLDAIGTTPLGELRVGATLVARGWDEIGLAGLLWDGRTLAGISEASAALLGRAIGSRSLPVPVELAHLTTAAADADLGIPVVTLGPGSADVLVVSAPPVPPQARLPDRRSSAAWVSVVGRLAGDVLTVHGGQARVDRRCAVEAPASTSRVSVTGVAIPDPARIVVPCDGVRAAPRLALASARPQASQLGTISVTSTAAAIADSMAEETRALAAALFAGGASVLLLAGLAAWHVRRRGSDPVGDEASEADAPESQEPRLTLMPVPREHGP